MGACYSCNGCGKCREWIKELENACPICRNPIPEKSTRCPACGNPLPLPAGVSQPDENERQHKPQTAPNSYNGIAVS